MSEQNNLPNLSGLDDLSARLAKLPAHTQANVLELIEGLEEEAAQRAASEPAPATKTRCQDAKAERLAFLENGTRLLPVNQRLALHLIGELAMNYALSNSDLQDGNLTHLFETLSDALESGFVREDWRDVKAIHEAQS